MFSVYISMYLCIYIYIYIFIYVYICIYIYMYPCIHIHIYRYIHDSNTYIFRYINIYINFFIHTSTYTKMTRDSSTHAMTHAGFKHDGQFIHVLQRRYFRYNCSRQPPGDVSYRALFSIFRVLLFTHSNGVTFYCSRQPPGDLPCIQGFFEYVDGATWVYAGLICLHTPSAIFLMVLLPASCS